MTIMLAIEQLVGYYHIILTCLFTLSCAATHYEQSTEQLAFTGVENYYRVGGNVTMSCRITSSELFQLGNSSDIYLRNGSGHSFSNRWVKSNVTDNSTASFSMKNLTANDRAGYYCCLSGRSSSPICTKNEFSIIVIMPPMKPVLKECYILEWTSLTCRWYPTKEDQQYHCSDFVVQQLQVINKQNLSQNFSNCLSVTHDHESDEEEETIENIFEQLSITDEKNSEICVRIVATTREAKESSSSDIHCFQVLKILRPPPLLDFNYSFEPRATTLRWLMKPNSIKHGFPYIFNVTYNSKWTNGNESISTNETSVTVDWFSITIYRLWIYVSYDVPVINHQMSIYRDVLHLPASAPCRNPETVENAFYLLPPPRSSSSSSICQRVRFYFKHLKERDFCDSIPPSYEIQPASHPLCSPGGEKENDDPVQQVPPPRRAYLDASMPATKSSVVQIFARNNFGTSNDINHDVINVVFPPVASRSNISIIVEGDNSSALMSWVITDDDDGDDDDDLNISGFTIFYCQTCGGIGTCQDGIEWVQLNNESARQWKIEDLRNFFSEYQFGISIKRRGVGESIVWAEEYYSLRAAPVPPHVVSVVDEKMVLSWEPSSQNLHECRILGYSVCQCPDDGVGGCIDNKNCIEVSSRVTSHQFANLSDNDILWVSSVCRSGVSAPSSVRKVLKKTVQNEYIYTGIFIFSVFFVLVSLLAVCIIIRLCKKWHNKLTSGIEIRLPNAIFISKPPNQKMGTTSLTSGQSTHSTDVLPSSKLISSNNNNLLKNSLTSLTTSGSNYKFFVNGSCLSDLSPANHNRVRSPGFDFARHYQAVANQGSTQLMIDGDDAGPYCIINWKDDERGGVQFNTKNNNNNVDPSMSNSCKIHVNPTFPDAINELLAPSDYCQHNELLGISSRACDEFDDYNNDDDVDECSRDRNGDCHPTQHYRNNNAELIHKHTNASDDDEAASFLIHHAGTNVSGEDGEYKSHNGDCYCDEDVKSKKGIEDDEIGGKVTNISPSYTFIHPCLTSCNSEVAKFQSVDELHSNIASSSDYTIFPPVTDADTGATKTRLNEFLPRNNLLPKSVDSESQQSPICMASTNLQQPIEGGNSNSDYCSIETLLNATRFAQFYE